MVSICLLGGLCRWLPAEEESERWMLTPFGVHQVVARGTVSHVRCRRRLDSEVAVSLFHNEPKSRPVRYCTNLQI